MTTADEIKASALDFAQKDYAAWTADTSKVENFVKASDKLFFGDKDSKPLEAAKLPKDNEGIAAWIEANPAVKAEFVKLGDDEAAKSQALKYVEISGPTRIAKDALVALPNGEKIREAIDGKIEADYGDGDKTNKFKEAGFDKVKYVTALVDGAVAASAETLGTEAPAAAPAAQSAGASAEAAPQKGRFNDTDPDIYARAMKRLTENAHNGGLSEKDFPQLGELVAQNTPASSKPAAKGQGK
jgi:hypothetical protein